MATPLDRYLSALRRELAEADPALVQDALWEAKRRLEEQQARLAWEAPELAPEAAWERTVAEVGKPAALAAQLADRDRIVSAALRVPAEAPEAPETPWVWPSFLGVLAEPRAYTSLLYLLLTLLTGLFYGIWITVGLSVSLGLLILVVGLPLLVLVLGSVRALGMAEGRLVEVLLGERMPRRPSLLPPGRTLMQRLGGLFSDPGTWMALLYLLLQFPLGLLYLVILTGTLATALALTLAPALAAAVRELEGTVYWGGFEGMPPLWLLVGLMALGLVGLVASLHLALALGRFHAWIAKGLLVQRS
ncbi:MAG TPA: sensor domain-containing protein [Holophaga sp.]|nr:sensor domain-containing protein [Holophaga sp.]